VLTDAGGYRPTNIKMGIRGARFKLYEVAAVIRKYGSFRLTRTREAPNIR